MTPMELASIVFLVTALWSVLSFATGARRLVFARRLRHLARADRVRSAFAGARTEFVHLALHGDLDSRSETFRAMYFLTTAAMRRQDEYEEMWRAIVKAVSSARQRRVNREAQQWSPGVARAMLSVVSALDVLIVEHSWLFRWVARAERYANPAHPAPVVIALQRAAKRNEEETARRLREYQAEVREMARPRLPNGAVAA